MDFWSWNMDFSKQGIYFCFGLFCKKKKPVIRIPTYHMVGFRFRGLEFISFQVESFVEVDLWTFKGSDFNFFFQSSYKGQKKNSIFLRTRHEKEISTWA